MINLHCCNDQYALNANYYVYISIISLLGYYLEERQTFKKLKGKLLYIKQINRDFPGGPVVKSPPCNAGDASLIPGQGTKIRHATGQLSVCATTTELLRLNQSPHSANYRAHVLWNPHATTREEKRKPGCHNQREARTPQREIPHASTKIPCAATKTRCSQKNKLKK